MKILHLCSYYFSHDLYQNLFTSLSKLNNIEEYIYVPIKKYQKNDVIKNIEGRNIQYANIHLKYALIINNYHRFLYYQKIKMLYYDIIKKYNIKTFNIIHAHTLYSDGGVAYLLSIKYNIDYIIAIRNTDINIFYKYFFHTRSYIYKVLLRAKYIIFISEAYKQTAFRILPKYIVNKISSKCITIPNGINQEWLVNEHNNDFKAKAKEIIITQISELTYNKNIQSTIKACSILKQQGYLIKINIVGSGNYLRKLKRLCKKLKMENNTIFWGYVKDIYVLKNILQQSSVFVMPSFHETFGVVYIESLSQGVPIIYSKDQGVDKIFKSYVGEAVNPYDIIEISKAIEKLSQKRIELKEICKTEAYSFNWNNIAKIYYNLYNSFINGILK